MATSKTPGPKPSIYTVEGNMHGRISGATDELVMPLRVPYRTFKRLMDISEDQPLDHLERFIEEMNLGDAKKVLDEADDVIDVITFAYKYFAEFNEVAQARLGELQASSGA